MGCIMRKQSFLRKVQIHITRICKLIVLSAFIFLGCVCIWFGHDTATQAASGLDYITKDTPPKTDPRIKYVMMYEKSRFSHIPIEIAELQAKLIVAVADEKNIPYELLVAIVEKESFFIPTLTSFAGATGLSQILIEAHVKIDEKKRYDIRYNLEKGCEIFSYKMKAARNQYSLALQYYSDYAHNYSDDVFANVGRFTLFAKNIETANKDIASAN